MPIVRISLNIDDSTYAAIQAGALELCGLAKDTATKRVAKHIPTVADAAMDSVSKAIDFVRAHKKETFLIGGIIVVGGTVAGTIGHVLHRKQRKLDAQFGKALQIYLDSARDGTLTLEILNDLIISIETIEKNSPKISTSYRHRCKRKWSIIESTAIARFFVGLRARPKIWERFPFRTADCIMLNRV